MPKKIVKKYASIQSGIVKKYAVSIEKFLKKTGRSYSEPQLIQELFKIPLESEGYVPRLNEVEKLRNIRGALKLLMNEKKVFGVSMEDPSNEQVLHYSTKGWYDTP